MKVFTILFSIRLEFRNYIYFIITYKYIELVLVHIMDLWQKTQLTITRRRKVTIAVCAATLAAAAAVIVLPTSKQANAEAPDFLAVCKPLQDMQRIENRLYLQGVQSTPVTNNRLAVFDNNGQPLVAFDRKGNSQPIAISYDVGCTHGKDGKLTHPLLLTDASNPSEELQSDILPRRVIAVMHIIERQRNKFEERVEQRLAAQITHRDLCQHPNNQRFFDRASCAP